MINSISMVEEEDALILVVTDDTKFEKYIPKPEVLDFEDGMFDHLSEEEKKSLGGGSSHSSQSS
jgi:hypothetical protein